MSEQSDSPPRSDVSAFRLSRIGGALLHHVSLVQTTLNVGVGYRF